MALGGSLGTHSASRLSRLRRRCPEGRSSSIQLGQHAVNGQENTSDPLHAPLARRPDHRDPCLVEAEGQAQDGRAAADMLESAEAKHIVLADRALRDAVAEPGVIVNIKPMPTRSASLP
jgi:hypothetical protein